MTFFSDMPEQAELFDILALKPVYFKHWTRGMQELMRGPSPLSVEAREIIGAYVSALNDCEYCAGGHQAAAVAFGVAPDFLDALVEDVETAPVDDRLKPILRYVAKLTRTPARMVEADAGAVIAAGWSEQALLDAMLVCGAFNFINRLVSGSGLPAIPEKLLARGQLLKKGGYKVPGIYQPEDDA